MNELFGVKHLIIVAICAVLCVGLFFAMRRLRLRTVFKIMFYVGIVSEIIKIFYYIVTNEDEYHGILPKTDLPFHLCSIQIIFFAILNLSKNDELKRFLLSFMLPSCLFGGAAAILIATSSSLNGLWIITAQYFLFHVALVVFSLYLFGAKELKLTIKDYFNCLKFLVVLMFFAVYINSVLYDGESNINFMYVASPPQDGLPFLNENHGWLVYIVHYACLILLCVSLVYIKPIIEAVKKKIARKSSVNISNAEAAATVSEEKPEQE